jgi:hypothetical protein
MPDLTKAAVLSVEIVCAGALETLLVMRFPVVYRRRYAAIYHLSRQSISTEYFR